MAVFLQMCLALHTVRLLLLYKHMLYLQLVSGSVRSAPASSPPLWYQSVISAGAMSQPCTTLISPLPFLPLTDFLLVAGSGNKSLCAWK